MIKPDILINLWSLLMNRNIILFWLIIVNKYDHESNTWSLEKYLQNKKIHQEEIKDIQLLENKT